jgi:hypothetical protein
MTSPAFNYFYRVEIEIANYELGGYQTGSSTVREVVTKTYNFVNKPLLGANAAVDRETYIPILKSVGDISLAAGDILPSISFSSITLSDERGTFGSDRRFSDLLERSTIIGRQINFYIGESQLNIDAPQDIYGLVFTKIGSGLVESWTKALSGDSAEITIQIQPARVSQRIMNLEVSPDIPGMEDAPDSSIGASLPITFCRTNYNKTMQFPAQEVVPIRISGDGESDAKYALTTQMYQLTKAITSNYVYIKKNWPESTFEWLGVCPSFGSAPSDFTASITANTYSLNTLAASAYQIPEILKISDSEGFIVTAVELRVKGQSSSTTRVSNAYLSMFILMVDRTTYSVIGELARGRAALATYDVQNNILNNIFTIKISLNNAIPLDLSPSREYDFYLGFEATDVAAGDLVICQGNYTPPFKRLIKDRTAGAGDSYTDWKISPDTVGIIAHRLHRASIAFNEHENLFTPSGLTYSSMSITQSSANVGQVNPSLDSIQMVTPIEGFAKHIFNGGTSYGPFDEYYIDISGTLGSVDDDNLGKIFQFTSHQSNTGPAILLVNNGSKYITAPMYYDGSPIPGGFLATNDLANFEYTDGVFNYISDADNIRIYDPPTILKLLSYEWNGEMWKDKDNVDITTLKTSHYDQLFEPNTDNHRARVLGGIVESKSNYSQVVSQIARGTASKIGIHSDGKLFIFPWGIANSISYTIPQWDIIPLSWETRDEDNIVNRTQISFERSFLNNTSEGGAFNYSIDFSNSSYLTVQSITERSRSLYGTKEIIENSFPVFGHSRASTGPTLPAVGLPGYLTGGATASTPGGALSSTVKFSVDFLADYYLSRFALPFVYCSFVVPYHRYKDIKMFDVISFHHSEFPAFFGTDPYARDGVVDDGTNVTTVPNANNGEELVRAKSYRGLVEGVSYIMAMEHAPAIKLTVQVLINQEFDPT